MWLAWRHNPLQHFYKVPRSLEEDFYPDRIANEATVCVIRAKKLLSVQKDKDAADAMVSLSLRGSDKLNIRGSSRRRCGRCARADAFCTVQDVDDPGADSVHKMNLNVTWSPRWHAASTPSMRPHDRLRPAQVPTRP